MKFTLDIKIAIFIFFLSLVGTIFQSLYIYDSFHWAVIQSSIDFNNGLLPYKDFFVHYGPLHTLNNSLALYLSNNNLISTMILSGISFSLGNILIFLISKKVFNLEFSIYLPIIIFLLHPFSNQPWPNYQFLFFISCSLLLLLYKKSFYLFLSGLFLSLSSLTYENFLIITPLVLILYFWVNHHLRDNLFLFLGFITPLVFFHVYLFSFDLHTYWFKTFDLNSVFLEINGISLIELIFTFFNEFFYKSFFNIFSESYFLIFFFIFISCLFFIFSIFIKVKKKENISLQDKYLFIIAIISILMLGSALHKINIFRFSTGPIVGIIVLIFVIEKYIFKYKNIILFFLISLLFSSAFVPYKQENNRFFPNFEKVKSSYNEKSIDLFKSQKWNSETWSFILKIDETSKNVETRCNNIEYFLNFTKDGFIYMISKKYLDTNQYIYWYDRTKYFEKLNNHFNSDMDKLLKKSIFEKNTLIFVDSRNISYLKKNFDLKNFKIKDLPYTYQQKSNFLLYPKECNY